MRNSGGQFDEKCVYKVREKANERRRESLEN